METLETLRRHQRLLRSERDGGGAALASRGATPPRPTSAPRVRHEVAAAFAAAAAALPAVRHATPGVGRRVAGAHLPPRPPPHGDRRGRPATAEDFHAWRKATKDLWYAVRLFEPAWPGPLDALAAELHALSQLLGDEHDLTVLRGALGDAGGDPPLLTPRLERAIAPPREARGAWRERRRG